MLPLWLIQWLHIYWKEMYYTIFKVVFPRFWDFSSREFAGKLYITALRWNLWFSSVFRRYKMGTLFTNRSISFFKNLIVQKLKTDCKNLINGLLNPSYAMMSFSICWKHQKASVFCFKRCRKRPMISNELK